MRRVQPCILRTQEQHPWSSCHHCRGNIGQYEGCYTIETADEQQEQGKNVPQLKVLATLQGKLALGLALDALQSQHNLLGSLGLLVEDRLGLTTITGLLAHVTTLSLDDLRVLTLLVLSDLVRPAKEDSILRLHVIREI